MPNGNSFTNSASERCNVEVKIQTVLSQNMTLVYDLLDLQAIDSSKLKGFMGVQTKPMVMDTPEMIVAVYPPEPTIIQIGDRRIRITLQQHSENVGSVPLWEITVKCNQLVPESKSTLVAYGFNYDAGLTLAGERNAHEVSIELFVPNPQMIEDAIEGHLLSFIPRLRFQRGQTRYDLVLEPIDEQHMKVHMNAHFELGGIALPPQSQLQASFYEEYEYLVSMLPRLFEGDSDDVDDYSLSS